MTEKEKKVLKATIMGLCMPLGLQNLSSPVGPLADETSSWLPTYRYLDGGYTDNTGLTHTIARMQADCSAPNSMYDCSEGVRAAVMNSGSRDPTRGSIKVDAMFANYTGNTPFPNIAGPGYPLQIFNESWPGNDDPGWTMYSNYTYLFHFKNGTEMVPETVVSWVWQGNVTTVDNAAFGVAAGTQVNLALFMADHPSEDKVISTGSNATFAFSTVYSQVAQVHADSAQAYLEMWAAGSRYSSRDFASEASYTDSNEL
jgi:hypothetical protein